MRADWRQPTRVAAFLAALAFVPALAAAAPQDPYATLHKYGLVDKPAAASPTLKSAVVSPSAGQLRPTKPAAQPLPLVKPAPVAEAASAAEPPPSALSRAYELLRAKGLLPGLVPGKVRVPLRAPPSTMRVLVDKSDRKLFVLRDGKPFREYRISLGGMPVGHKQREGDLRTPEGVYTLDWRNPRSRYYKSIHISYPNDQDRRRAAELGVDPGGHIMLHGEHYEPAMRRTLRRSATPKDWTEGCIALNNEHMDEIWREVPDGTTIEIRP